MRLGCDMHPCIVIAFEVWLLNVWVHFEAGSLNCVAVETAVCFPQVGGTDQWGNITAGCDLVRKRLGKEVYGATIPLLTTAAGDKFGKSAGNAVWLSPQHTSPYHMYQFFLNTADQDLPRFLRLFTFLSLADIDTLMVQHARDPHLFVGQKALAAQVTGMLHGAAGVDLALRVSDVLFGKSKHANFTTLGLAATEWLSVFAGLPFVSVAKADLRAGINILDFAVLCRAFDGVGTRGRSTCSL